MSSPPSGPAAASRRRGAVIASILFALAVAEAVTAVVAGLTAHMAWTAGDNVLVITNGVNGLALAIAGWPVAVYRPRNPIGWLLLAGGCLYVSSATGYALLENAPRHAAGLFWRTIATFADATWAPAITFCLPVALLLFPEGRLPSRRWRWVVALAAAGTLTTFAGGMIGVPAPAHARGIDGWIGTGSRAILGVTYILAGVCILTTFGTALAALIVRFRRAATELRRQLSWPLLALGVVFLSYIPNPYLNSTVGVLLTAAIPISITIAIFRRHLFDIQLVFARSLSYVLLTAGVVGAYLVLVAFFARVFGTRSSTGSSVLATIVIAAGFNPVRVFLQRFVDRAVYGARRDPVRAIAEVGARLGGVGPGGTGLGAVLKALCDVMRLPSAAITVHGNDVAAYGDPAPVRHTTPLEQGDERIGDLVVGLRSGEARLAAGDVALLDLLAAPVAVAVRANLLAVELRESRERVITGREEERRRLRRDLHDGLGPMLTGVVLNAEAALRLVHSDPERSGELLQSLRDQTTGALDDIRRLVYDLRPPALDSLGLLGALHEYAMSLTRRVDGAPLTVSVEAPEPLAELPAAVEVAAYRIVTEALTNVARHSRASSAAVRVRVVGPALHIGIHDDGVNANEYWVPGVGLTSIRERAAELGGASTVSHDRAGGRVDVRLPLSHTELPSSRTEVPLPHPEVVV